MSGNAAQFTIVISALDKATATMRAINQSAHANLVAPFANVGKSIAALAEETGLTTLGERAVLVGEKFGALGQKISGLLGPLAALGAAATAGGLFELAKGAAEFGHQLDLASIKTGVSADALAKLHYVAKVNGVEADKMDLALERLNRTIGQTASGHNKQAAALFAAMHISLHNADGTLKDANTLFGQLGDHFQRNASMAQKTNAAFILFGRSGANLLPLLSRGGDEIRKLSDRFEKFYGKLTPEVLKAAREGTESFETLNLAADGLKFTLGSALLPVISDLISPLTEWVAVNRDLIKQKVHEWAVGVGTALKKVDWKSVGDAIGAFGSAIGTAFKWLGPFWSTIAVASVVMSPFIAATLSAGFALVKLGWSLGAVTLRFATLAWTTLPGVFLSMSALTETALPALSRAFLATGLAIEATPVGWILTGIAGVGFMAYQLYENWQFIPQWWHNLWQQMGSDVDEAWARMHPNASLVEKLHHRVTSDGRSIDTSADYGGFTYTPRPIGAPAGSFAPIIGARGAAASAPGADGQVHVKVDINGLPNGSKASATTSGSNPPSLSLDLGRSWERI